MFHRTRRVRDRCHSSARCCFLARTVLSCTLTKKETARFQDSLQNCIGSLLSASRWCSNHHRGFGSRPQRRNSHKNHKRTLKLGMGGIVVKALALHRAAGNAAL